jgi:transmembrane protein 231
VLTATITTCYAVTTSLEQPLVVWEGGNTQNFTLEVEMSYPILTVLYSPGFWQLLKFAWIQYLAIFIIFWWVVSKVQSFVFQNQVILTVKKKQHKQ